MFSRVASVVVFASVTLSCSTNTGGVGAMSPSPSHSPIAAITPKPISQPSVTKDNLSGYWYASDRAIATGSISSCEVLVRYALDLKQSEHDLSGKSYVFSATQVTRIFDEMESVTGINQGGEVQMQGKVESGPSTGAKNVYNLKFDEASSHLVGTRNGQAVWLVPLKIEDCK